MDNVSIGIALLGWIPFVVVMFAAMRARQAVIWSFLLAWLFLPVTRYTLAGLPDYTKMSATCAGVLLGAMFFDTARLGRFRPVWLDLPMLIWCVCPLASSLSNGLGVYDGVSAVVGQAATWGLPYFIGRLYFPRLEDMRELAVGIFIGGLIYIPLCLYEVRMSPQLHNMVYGFHQHSWAQTYRFGGWRPTVFMQHGLMVGMWMCMSALVGVWLCYCRALPRSMWRIPTTWTLVALVATAVMCKSIGAVALMAAGMGVLFAAYCLRWRWVVIPLVLAAPAYAVSRVGGLWDAHDLVTVARGIAGNERAGSLQFRMRNEDMLSAKAMQRPMFGWGGWGRSRVYSEQGRDASVTDGLWVITLGAHGMVGLGSLTLAILLPVGMAFRHLRQLDWIRQETAAVPALGVVVILYWIDCIPNAMANPIFTLVAGGLASVAIAVRKARPVLSGPPAHVLALRPESAN